LAGLGIDMTNLGSSDGITTYASGILLNGGGTLAPGDIGTAGKTTITGSYSNAPSAVLAIDIGGSKQGDAFTNAPGYYDTLRVDVGATTLAGQLRVSLINSYVPLTTNRFTVLLCTNGLFGTFANVTDKILPLADGYSLFTNVTQSATNVILSGYAVNEYLGGSWDSTASWSQGVIPVDQNYAAYFGTLASAFSPNVGTRTLKGLVFANPSSFTLSGTALTLQGDASIKVTAGSHTISVPLALSNVTEIAVAPDSLLTLSGGITGGQAVAKTGTGTLALSGVNTTLGALTVSAGTVRFTAGTTTVSALTITAGATCDFTAGTLYILKNGGGTDTIEEVNAAITANSITRRGSNALPADFKVTEETINSVVYIKVVAKVNGTVISFQ
jgi:autotransporter-associated beta strand protein